MGRGGVLPLKYQSAVFASTNDQRARRDLVQVRKQACLQRFAAAQAKRRANAGDIFHQSLTPILKADLPPARVEGGWSLPGNLTIANDVLDGQPKGVVRLGEDPYDEQDAVAGCST